MKKKVKFAFVISYFFLISFNYLKSQNLFYYGDKNEKINLLKISDTLLQSEYGFYFYPSNEIILKFKENVSENSRNNIINYFSLNKIKTTITYDLYKTSSFEKALEISNYLMENDYVIYAHPNFRVKYNFFSIPNDIYFEKQWYLHNIGQIINDNHTGSYDVDIDAPEAWEITKGNSNIKVAVIDCGIPTNHPDLPASRLLILPGCNITYEYDYPGYNDPDNPAPWTYKNHGIACAGIIAASQNNYEGISGIAPEAIIMPIKLTPIDLPISEYVDAINFAYNNDADVLSLSIGFDFCSPNCMPSLTYAINNLINNGRIGKGCVVTVSASNSANHIEYNRGYIVYPANINNKNLITVGASNRYDFYANYSPWSNISHPWNQLLDIVAPSHNAYPCQINNESFDIWTLDIDGNKGMNPYNFNPNSPVAPCFLNPPAYLEILPDYGPSYLSYSGRFGGTSASAPMVAGVVALVLSLYPLFTADEVYEIITQSADKVGNYQYIFQLSSLGNYPGYSEEMGYGRLNAFNALLYACDKIPENKYLNGIVNENNISHHIVKNKITSNQIFEVNSKGIYQAGNEIILTDGFVAKEGSNFHAFIEKIPCPSNAKNLLNENKKKKLLNFTSYNVINDLKNEDFVFAFPNPFDEYLYIYLALKENEMVKIYLQNIVGQACYEIINTTLQKNNYKIKVEKTILKKLNPGIYILICETTYKQKVIKLIKF